MAEFPERTIAGASAASIRVVAERHGASRFRVFGSFARGDNTSDSDLDLLIDLEPGRNLLDLIAIKQDLEDVLGIPVHVVTQNSISPHMGDAVLREAVPI